MSEADKRTLKVKTGVVKRLRKELDMYQQEVQTEQAKVQKLKNEGADPHDIKYAVGLAADQPTAAASPCLPLLPTRGNGCPASWC